VAKARRALIEHRPRLLAGVIAALAFYFLWNNPIGGLWLIAIKGAAVGSLAIYTWRWSVGVDGTILTVALALSAAADMAIELWFEVGGAIFALAHVVAVGLYWKNRREMRSASQNLLGAALLIATPVISYLLSDNFLVGIYGLILGAMAASAWTSRFPRYRVGLGAVLFVMSDWLIFSRMGAFDLGVLPDVLVWPLYFAAQLMIATGIVQTLRGERPAR
jgi:hypothetical protein